jgi:predicted O-methyltransferase YrrM
MHPSVDVLRRGLRRAILPPPTSVRHAEYSMLFSADDEVGRPNDRLLGIALDAVQAARSVDISAPGARIVSGPRYTDVWPGEHYKLLAGLVEVLQPEVVIEIGTATGLSALTLLERLPAAGRVVTFDVVPWQQYPGAVLRAGDFASGRLVQHIADLADPAVAATHRELLESADLIFMDAAKDGQMERSFIALFESLRFEGTPVALYDDIRLWNMLDIWRGIRRPKLDLTSFGHWSGTGLVDYAP